mmetsp:Transcript_16442/g.38531  ORF Transcript_16442/g.38531 Transcript_16442/m.38531 type:complete len:166 (+) Transcript_16442:500-997(+)
MACATAWVAACVAAEATAALPTSGLCTELWGEDLDRATGMPPGTRVVTGRGTLMPFEGTPTAAGRVAIGKAPAPIAPVGQRYMRGPVFDATGHAPNPTLPKDTIEAELELVPCESTLPCAAAHPDGMPVLLWLVGQKKLGIWGPSKNLSIGDWQDLGSNRLSVGD